MIAHKRLKSLSCAAALVCGDWGMVGYGCMFLRGRPERKAPPECFESPLAGAEMFLGWVSKN